MDYSACSQPLSCPCSDVIAFEKAYCEYRLNRIENALKTIQSASQQTDKLKELYGQVVITSFSSWWEFDMLDTVSLLYKVGQVRGQNFLLCLEGKERYSSQLLQLLWSFSCLLLEAESSSYCH